MSTYDERVLGFNPWEGDRDSNCKTLRDRMVVARKAHQCAVCFDDIRPGERIRAQTEVSYDERKVMTFRFCPKCCDAMDASSRDGGEAIRKRTSLGLRKAEGAPCR